MKPDMKTPTFNLTKLAQTRASYQNKVALITISYRTHHAPLLNNFLLSIASPHNASLLVFKVSKRMCGTMTVPLTWDQSTGTKADCSKTPCINVQVVLYAPSFPFPPSRIDKM